MKKARSFQQAYHFDMVPRDRLLIALGDQMHLRHTSNRYVGFQPKFLRIQKYGDYKQ